MWNDIDLTKRPVGSIFYCADDRGCRSGWCNYRQRNRQAIRENAQFQRQPLPIMQTFQSKSFLCHCEMNGKYNHSYRITRKRQRQEHREQQTNTLCIALSSRQTQRTRCRSADSGIAQCLRSTEEALRLSVGDLMDKVLR